MLSPKRLWRRLGALLSARTLDDELDEEMRFHMEMEAARHIRSGVPEDEARVLARRDFGGVSRHRDAARDARGVRPIEDFASDVRVASRALLKQRTYATVAILTLAIGIGATTALWSAVYRVLLAPYPFAEADRIVALYEYDTRRPLEHGEVAPADYLHWKERARSFDLLAAAEPWSVDWIGPEGPERFGAALVTEDAFPIQGLRPLLGRTFLPEEFERGRGNVLVMSEALWRNRFGADSALVGNTLVVDSVPHTVVGVMPAVALNPYGADVWLPKILSGYETTRRRGGWWTVMGRLAPGVTIEQARAEMRTIAAELEEQFPATNRNIAFAVTSLRDAIAGDARGGLMVLFGAVGFVLLIACVNVANLQLAESVRRRRELAIRTAIGAGRGRIVRQLLTESSVVSAIGAAAGLAVAWWGIRTIRQVAPDDLWQLKQLSFDGTVWLFALGLACVTTLTIGAMPVIAAGRIRLAEALAAGGRSSAGGRARRRANRVLVVSEVALALVLLVGAGLLLRSLGTLLQVDRGFRVDNVLVTTLQAWNYYPTSPHRAEFVRSAVERLNALPGVEHAGMTSSLPLDYPIGFERAPFTIVGRSNPSGDELPSVRVAATTPGYFEALEIPLIQGRAIDETDRAGGAAVALVNQAFVRQYFPEGNPLRQRVTFGFQGAPTAREIIGVVGDVRHDGLDADAAPGVFVPHAQAATGAIHLVVSTTGDPLLLQRTVRRELSALNGAMPLSEMKTMNALFARSLRERRFQLGLLGVFSSIALLLSAIGIYGVMSRATAERTHEIGVRMAVGANASDVRWMVLRAAGMLAILGVLAGTLIAALLTRSMAGMLFGVTPLDPLAYGGAAAVLLATAVLATLVPALRASGVDPVEALRDE